MPVVPLSLNRAARRRTWTVIGAALAAASAPCAFAAGAHVHGVAQLRVVIDGSTLEVALESPLDNLLGFERAPRSERERTAVRNMAATLRQQAQTLLAPTAAAQCALVSVQLVSGVLAPALLGEPAPATAAPPATAGSGGDHAELDATFSFRCAAPAQLQGLDVGLSKAFPGLRRLEVQVAGPKGQSASVLTPGQRAVRW